LAFGNLHRLQEKPIHLGSLDVWSSAFTRSEEFASHRRPRKGGTPNGTETREQSGEFKGAVSESCLGFRERNKKPPRREAWRLIRKILLRVLRALLY